MEKTVLLLFSFLASPLLTLTHSSDLGPYRSHSGNATLNIRTATGGLRVVIDKSDYELHVYEDDEWLATYPVVFGSRSQDDKRMEGDRLTPEGSFRIIHRKHHAEWGRFLLLDYPNPESRQKFEKLKRAGRIPAAAKIGGGIGIHGTRPSEEYTVDKYINWTLGCVSLKHSEMLELYDLLPVGTPVEIRR